MIGIRLEWIAQWLLLLTVGCGVLLAGTKPPWLMSYIGFALVVSLFQTVDYLNKWVMQRVLNHVMLSLLLLVVLVCFWLRGVIAAPLEQLPPLPLYMPFALLWVPVTIHSLFYVYTTHWITRWVRRMVVSSAVMGIMFFVLLELTLRVLQQQSPHYLQSAFASADGGLLHIFPSNQPGEIFGQYPIEGNRFINAVVNVSPQGQNGGLFRHTCAKPLPVNPTPIMGDTYTVHYDRFGFREQAVDVMGDPDLVVLGDSFSVLPQVKPIYWERLTDNTLALARAGIGTIEQSIIFEHFIVEMGKTPEVVILQYFEGNDIRENQRFDIESQDAVSRDMYPPYAFAYSYYLAKLAFTPRQVSGTTNPTTEVFPCPYPVVDLYGHPLAFLSSYISMLTLSSATIEQSNEWLLTTNALDDIKQMTDDIGAELIIVYVPTKFHVHMDSLTDEQIMGLGAYLRAFSPQPDNLFAVDGTIPKREVVRLLRQNASSQRDLVADYAAQNDILFLDMTPRFKQTVQGGDPVYFWMDTHWNQLGSDLTREEIIGLFIANRVQID